MPVDFYLDQAINDEAKRRKAGDALLTDLELEAMTLTGTLANLLRRIIGDGPTAEHDWAETAADVHRLQQRIMSQAAARAYPDKFRLMGGSFRAGGSE